MNNFVTFSLQVFEILLHYAEFSDWERAFYHVIPKRKGLTSHQQQSDVSERGSESGEGRAEEAQLDKKE